MHAKGKIWWSCQGGIECDETHPATAREHQAGERTTHMGAVLVDIHLVVRLQVVVLGCNITGNIARDTRIAQVGHERQHCGHGRKHDSTACSIRTRRRHPQIPRPPTPHHSRNKSQEACYSGPQYLNLSSLPPCLQPRHEDALHIRLTAFQWSHLLKPANSHGLAIMNSWLVPAHTGVSWLKL